MPTDWTRRPAPDEYAPFYAGYIGQVPDGDLVELLERQVSEVLDLLEEVDDERAEHRYAPEKWSVGEVVGHLTDTERVMAYRALRFARGDATQLPGFDENLYVAKAGFGSRSILSLVDEWATVRRSTHALFAGLDPATAERRGVANTFGVSVLALAAIIVGHTTHHLQILRERYGLG